MASSEIRTRIAPSPTGDPHVGTAYQALFNYAFAKGRGGAFILRIEDTDQLRSTKQSEDAILSSLRWLGLRWDEGPDVGGPHAPYRQSERSAIYTEHVERLLAAGHAYRCFCTKERLDEMRARLQAEKASQLGYDRHCRAIAPEEAAQRARAGEPHVVRMKIPVAGECVMQDLLRGEIRKDWASVDDQVIMKSDGLPTYHLANVVDDHLMGVSHVIRGEEWINSVPKHLKLYEYFGWDAPIFCHLPLLRNNDPKKTKLSKRKNPTSIHYYRRAGYLPEALLNFLGMMGWLMPNGEEKFTPAEMAAHLELEDVSLGGPVFDTDKLKWLNGRYLRENYDARALRGQLEAWALNAEMFDRIIPLIHPRLETMADWGRLTAPFFSDQVAIDLDQLKMKGKDAEELVTVLQIVVWELEKLHDFAAGPIEACLKSVAERLAVKVRDLNLPLYVALSGTQVWTPLYGSMEVLGSDMVRMRLRAAIEALGGLSSKRLKRIEKEYAERFGPDAKA